MSTITTTQTFNEGDQVTASTLNDIALNSAFATTVVDNSTTALVSNGNGDINSQIIVRDGGITNSKLGLSATGSSQNILTLSAVQNSGNRFMHIRTPADVTSNNSPFEFITGNAFTFIVDSTAAVTMFNDGNVGIKNSTPSYPLDVYGDIKSSNNIRTGIGGGFISTYSAGKEVNLYHGSGYGVVGTTGETKMAIRTNNTDRVTVLSDGKVGVGDTTPDELLTIKGGSNPKIHIKNTVEDDAGIKFSDYDAVSTQNFEILYNSSTQDLRFRSDSVNNLLYLKDDGDVGIGTDSPSNKLQVAGTLRATGNVDFDSNLNVDGNVHIDGTFGFDTGTSVTAIETDGTLGGNSDNVLPTEKAIKTYVDAQILASKKDLYPVGSIFTSASSSHNTPSNVASALGFGTWQAYGAGRVLVGKESSGTFSSLNGETGAETVTLSDAQVPVRDHSHFAFDASSGTQAPGSVTSTFAASFKNTSFGSQAYNIQKTSRGSGASKANAGLTSNPTTSPAASAHSNLQPSVVVYMWKRTN